MDGFLGTRGSWTIDLVFTALFAVVPLVAASVYAVRRRHAYRWHKGLQIAVSAGLLLAVGALEVEIRLRGWQDRARPSPYWREGPWNDWIDYWLAIHLAFAVPTFVLWTVVVVRAWRHFPVPPGPNRHSRWHRRFAWPAAGGMLLTAVTGWLFYVLAFAA